MSNRESKRIEPNSHLQNLDLEIPDSKEKQQTQSSRMIYVSPSFLCPDLFSNNNNILIDENGLMSAPEEKRGKFTFFGIEPNPEKEDHQCDIVVTLDNSTFPQKYQNKKFPLFYIVFDKKVDSFLLKSLTKEFYFSFILTPFKQVQIDIQRKTYFKLGKVLVTISIRKDIKTIQIKVRKSEFIKEKQIYTFTEERCPITIGRMNADIVIKNNSVSKSHVTIDFDKSTENYFLVDNGSTNGTQLLLHESKTIVLNDTMNFNLGNKQFKIEEKK